MTLAKLFGWIFASILAAAVLNVGVGLVRMMFLADPHTDPLPQAIEVFSNTAVILLAAAVAGLAYVVCRLAKV